MHIFTLKKKIIESYFLSSEIYRVQSGKTHKLDYEIEGDELLHLYEFDINRIIPFTQPRKKGGIKWCTAIKNNYLVFFTTDKDVFFYDDSKES